MQNLVRNGNVIPFTNSSSSTVQGGSLVAIGATGLEYVAVATKDIVPGETGICHLEGVFSFSKGNTDLAQGAAVYLGTATDVAATGSVYVGRVETSAGASEAMVEVRLNFMPPTPEST